MHFFVGMHERALDFLHLKGTPAIRQVRILYPDGTEKILSEHRFIEIQYEQKQSEIYGDVSLIAYYKDGEQLFEERVQREFVNNKGKYLFTALWDIPNMTWIQTSLWTDQEVNTYAEDEER